jgi:hypothetical protein
MSTCNESLLNQVDAGPRGQTATKALKHDSKVVCTVSQPSSTVTVEPAVGSGLYSHDGAGLIGLCPTIWVQVTVTVRRRQPLLIAADTKSQARPVRVAAVEILSCFSLSCNSREVQGGVCTRCRLQSALLLSRCIVIIVSGLYHAGMPAARCHKKMWCTIGRHNGRIGANGWDIDCEVSFSVV